MMKKRIFKSFCLLGLAVCLSSCAFFQSKPTVAQTPASSQYESVRLNNLPLYSYRLAQSYESALQDLEEAYAMSVVSEEFYLAEKNFLNQKLLEEKRYYQQSAYAQY